MTVYHVKGWNEHYENNRSRKVENLAWVPIPNHHDGERYSAIWQEPNGIELFGAWVLILQVASKCHPRGSLVRSTGEPHTPKSLASKTRASPIVFDHALTYFAKNGWLTTEMHEQQEFMTERHLSDTQVASKWQAGDEEQKGREQKEVKGMEAAAPPASSDSEWVESLRTLPAYDHCNVGLEYDKCLAHFQAKRIKCTRTRFLAWLGRIERPLGALTTPIHPKQVEPANWRETLKKLYPENTFDGPWAALADSVKAEIQAA